VKCVNYVVKKPVGVACLISPWNLPLYLLTWKIAPCIAVCSFLSFFFPFTFSDILVADRPETLAFANRQR
jgi:Aldehyde dehydrogenase family